MTDFPPHAAGKQAPSPRRIALVSTELGVGGAERCLTRLALGLDRRRFAPQVVSLAPRPRPPLDSLVRELEAAEVPLRFLDLRGWFRLPRAWLALKRLLQSESIDLAQSFLFHANLLSAAARPRTTLLVGGVRVADPRRRRHAANRWAARRMAALVCVSDAVARFCREVEALPADKLRVIPNGLDLAGVDAAPVSDLRDWLGDAPHDELVVYLGRLHPQKGLPHLLEAWPRVLAERPRARLALVGDGPQRDALTQQAKTLGLTDTVFFSGWRPDPLGRLKAARLLVLPSLWEGMPNAVLEAMAAGRPVVASDVQGVAELLGDSAAEQLVPPANPDALATGILRLLSDRALGERLGAANRRRVAEHFSLAAMVRAYESLYDELLTRRPPAAARR